MNAQVSAAASGKKMSSSAFSQYVMSIADLYDMAVRNGYYMPKQSCSAVNELMLFNVLQGKYWCPKTDEIRMKSIVKAPLKEVILSKLMQVCTARNLNIAWIDEAHSPNKEWLVHVIATLDPHNEIFRKDYVPPPIRKRLRDIETIVLPNELFEGLPKSTSKVKARRLKIMSEAFAAEKASRLKDMRKTLEDEIIEQEVRRDKYQQIKRPKLMSDNPLRIEEEKKDPTLLLGQKTGAFVQNG